MKRMIIIALGSVLAILLVILSYWGVRLYLVAQVSKRLVAAAVPYSHEVGDYRKPMLVLGDSTAVGVGADKPQDTVAALAAGYIHASNVENYAVSGAVVGDLPSQIAKAKSPHYDLILIQIGANDITRFRSPASVAARLGGILDSLPEADTVLVFVSAGDIGSTPLWRVPLGSIYTKLNIAYHAAFGSVAKTHGVTYVNLYEDPSTALITAHPETYFAADGFHLSSAGYALWFEAIRRSL